MDQNFLPWDDARLHVNTQAVLRGFNVFEGLRGYWTADESQLWLFRLRDHMHRLSESMKLLRVSLPYGLDVMEVACGELLRRCEIRQDVHLRIVVYIGASGEPGDTLAVGPRAEVGSFVLAIPRAGRSASSAGVHAAISSWLRIGDQSMPPRMKAGANYLNGRFAAAQARADGYDVAILLNERGKVTELPGSCLMMVRGGRLVTPPVTDNILESITRATVLKMAREDLEVEVDERSIDRTELYVADELFHCGTAEEITPIVSVDKYTIGSGETGSLTSRLQALYFSAVRGRMPKYQQHLTATYSAAATAVGQKG
jgi:branched-chain amino acid aminotransferase